MNLQCTPEEFATFLLALGDHKSTPSEAKKAEPIAGLSAPPSKEMQDYMETVSNFVFEHPQAEELETKPLGVVGAGG